MCLAIPMQVMHSDGLSARCQARGVERVVSLVLLQHEPPDAGDMVLVHLGQAVQKVSHEHAAEVWALLDEMLAADAQARAVVE
ncbi:MAG: HypC/HybG/HupF family hydrogenase formation chaperone [Burkholderiales bacterium]|nr:HypC/HybG/HupF family hydrogenase formation chaperone [Burkholderiales bacterium]